MASELFLRVLGPLSLERAGQQVDVGGPRQKAVLARLAVADGRPVTAEALLTDVWGPVAGDSAAASLHVSISKLRRVMDPGREARDSSPLHSTAGGYALAVPTDAVEAEKHVRRASSRLVAGDLAAALTELTDARSWWRGDPFEGLGEHGWLVLERRRCAELQLYVAELLAETALRLGHDAAGVVVDLTGLAEQHPTHERLAVLLAVALYRQHRQDDALRVLRSTRHHLRDDSGLDPGPDLQGVEQLILAQEPDPFDPPRRTRTQTTEPRQPPGSEAALPGRGYPLVGRGRPRAVLDAAAQAAESGQPTAVVLVGEGGIGKTRLARTVSDELVSRGWRAVWSHGTENEGAPALWPWMSILRELGRALPLPPELATLADGDGSVRSSAEPAADRWRQARLVTELLEQAARDTPLVVVLDDLQWMDADSHALLVELTTQSTGTSEWRLLVLVTSRPAGAGGRADTLARLTRLGAIRLDLEGLSDADVRALAAGAGIEVDAAALRERTEGNPFLLRETITFAAETGASPLDVVPASVADVLGARMARLAAADEDVLKVASVLGSVVDAGSLAAVAGLEPGEVDRGLEAGLEADLLSAGADGTIRFRHDLVRETAYARLGAVRRTRLHARALAQLAGTGARNPALLASHARAAGPSHADETVRWSIAAAEEAASRRAPDSALQWWQAAHAADRSALHEDPVRRVTVLLGLVRAQLDAGDAVGAIATRAEAVRGAVQADEPALVTQALTSLDRPVVWLPRPMGQVDAEMVQHLERALVATSEPGLRCRLMATLAVEIYAPGQEGRCDELTAESVRLAEDVGDPRMAAFALNARVVATAFPGRERERAEEADRLVEVGHESALPSVELAGHQLACRLRLQLFEVRVADEHARHARQLAAQLRLPLPALQQRLWDCSRRALGGDVTGALRMVDELEELEWPWWAREAMLATTRLTLLLRAGTFAEAAPLLDLAAQANPRIAADARTLVSVATGAGTPVAVDTSARQDWAWLSGGCIHAQAVLAVGDSDTIASTYELLLPASGMIAATGSFDAGPVDGYLADLARALGRPDDERRHRELLARLSTREGLGG
jgi:DNA-binding SARP family transcriptional activator